MFLMPPKQCNANPQAPQLEISKMHLQSQRESFVCCYCACLFMICLIQDCFVSRLWNFSSNDEDEFPQCKEHPLASTTNKMSLPISVIADTTTNNGSSVQSQHLGQRFAMFPLPQALFLPPYFYHVMHPRRAQRLQQTRGAAPTGHQ